MGNPIDNAIAILLQGRPLSALDMRAAVLQVMDGDAPRTALGTLLTALKQKGETVDEIVGTATALRDRAVRIPTTRTGLLDTCGTGGDELHTFNISTATAIVTAACGVPVAKHGNRGVSSRSGSADVLEALGVRIDLPPERVGLCIDEVGIGFCFAPIAHGAMKHAAPVRKELGFRTIFNLLGPLTNPAGAQFQLIGASRVAIAEKLAAAVARLGAGRALVVCGNDELDEVSLWGKTSVFQVDSRTIAQSSIQASDFGLPECRTSDLTVASPNESAAVIKSILAGHKGPARDIVLANSAAALLAAGTFASPVTGVTRAAHAIDSGNASSLLEKLVEFTQRQ